MRTLLSALAISLLSTATTGCTDDAVSAGDELIGVEDGKADDYYSNVAIEYVARGTLKIQMTDEQFADEAQRSDLVARRLTAVGLYLTAYVTDKFEGVDENNDGRISEDEIFFHNTSYGGFHAMVRTRSADAGNLTRVSAGHYTLKFEIDLAGPRNMRELLPRIGTSSPFKFALKMPEGASVDPAGVPRGAIRNWKPETATGPIETHELSLETLPTPGNAYLPYDKYTQDGTLDITLLDGWDYNTPRSDAREIKNQYNQLVAWGFHSPVARFEDLKADSGPLTREVSAAEQAVKIEVRLFYADMFESPLDFKARAIDELVKRDVFFYNGHAGPYYGFYLDGADIGKVTPEELTALPFTDKQQLFVAQGCQTYSQYADVLYEAPAKSEANLDVITTVNYSYGAGTMELVQKLVETDAHTNLQVPDAYALVAGLNADWLNEYREVFYGITGITDNSAVHPLADLAVVGNTCTTADDCGSESGGNLCVQPSANAAGKQCAARALADRCPTGTRFLQLRSGSTIVDAACVRN